MRLGVLTCVWKRHEIYEIYIDFIKRISKIKGLEVVPLSICSESNSVWLSANNDIEFSVFQNQPLASKWSHGMNVMKGMNVDYVLCLGSDDVMCNDTIKLYLEKMNQGIDFIGLKDLYIYSQDLDRLVYWGGYQGCRDGESSGLGRCLSKKLLDKLDWNPWGNTKLRGLDGEMARRLNKINYTESLISLKDNNLFAVDIKNKESMTHFKSFRNCQEVNKSIMNKCPEIL